MEILIRVVDKSPDPLASKAGDVIAVKPDGWAWTPEELTRTEWRIIQAPILQTLADALLLVDLNALTGQLARRRKWTLATSLLPAPSRFTGVRSAGIVVLSQADILAAASLKP